MIDYLHQFGLYSSMRIGDIITMDTDHTNSEYKMYVVTDIFPDEQTPTFTVEFFDKHNVSFSYKVIRSVYQPWKSYSRTNLVRIKLKPEKTLDRIRKFYIHTTNPCFVLQAALDSKTWYPVVKDSYRGTYCSITLGNKEVKVPYEAIAAFYSRDVEDRSTHLDTIEETTSQVMTYQEKAMLDSTVKVAGKPTYSRRKNTVRFRRHQRTKVQYSNRREEESNTVT